MQYSKTVINPYNDETVNRGGNESIMFDRKCKLNVLKDGIVLYLTGINLIGYYPH